MIEVTKYDNPKTTLVYTTYVVLKYLSKKKVVSYGDLYDHLKKNVEYGHLLFDETVAILFLLGKIEYSLTRDNFIYKS